MEVLDETRHGLALHSGAWSGSPGWPSGSLPAVDLRPGYSEHLPGCLGPAATSAPISSTPLVVFPPSRAAPRRSRPRVRPHEDGPPRLPLRRSQKQKELTSVYAVSRGTACALLEVPPPLPHPVRFPNAPPVALVVWGARGVLLAVPALSPAEPCPP